MYSRTGTIVAILMGAFPFFALGWKLFQDSVVGISVYGAIVLILVIGALLGPRLNLASIAVDDSSPERAPREPAAPIEWNWDGVNRQPDDKE
ncbi:MAG TPA: hypothetical protein VFX76_03235 [Roseiflexaceae bacterium]|nr:hypothetical protein [Roseiflexaceae bacterium]